MASSPYASAMGRLKVRILDLLPDATFDQLVNAKDLIEIAKVLEGTPYGPDLEAASTTYGPSQRLEVAINRVFVRRCRRALDASPFAGKPIVRAYVRRWDIQNIGLVLASRAEGRPISEAEAFLISSREFPAGMFAGAMTIDDFRQLLQLPTLESITQQLVKFGYGGPLLTRLDTYLRTKDIFTLLQALDQFYYGQLLESIKQFQGDEWNIRRFVSSEIDVRNALLMLKGKDADLPVDRVNDRFVDGGTLTRARVPDLYAARTVPDLVTALAPLFPALPEGLPAYQEHRTLTGFEAALLRERAIRELRRLRNYPLSLSILFTFLTRSELERTDLRRIVYGRQYGVPSSVLAGQLISPRL